MSKHVKETRKGEAAGRAEVLQQEDLFSAPGGVLLRPPRDAHCILAPWAATGMSPSSEKDWSHLQIHKFGTRKFTLSVPALRGKPTEKLILCKVRSTVYTNRGRGELSDRMQNTEKCMFFFL